jgi:hypothetical protein
MLLVNEQGGSVSRPFLLAVLLFAAASTGRADTGCLVFIADPYSYSAPAGGTFTVFTTYTNCGSDTTIFIGDGFGSDQSVNISGSNFYDPSFFLTPGQSIAAAFADYTWDPNAPGGFVWNPNINAVYVVLTGVCNGFDCDVVGGGFAWTDFTATVEQPVPEPTTLLLLSTGAIGVLLKARKHRQPRRRN